MSRSSSKSRASSSPAATFAFAVGLVLGGGVQWRSAPVVGQTPGNAGDPGRVGRNGRAYDTELRAR